jgi:hypothetical protein
MEDRETLSAPPLEPGQTANTAQCGSKTGPDSEAGVRLIGETVNGDNEMVRGIVQKGLDDVVPVQVLAIGGNEGEHILPGRGL